MKYGSNPIVLWGMKLVEAIGEKLDFILFSFYFWKGGLILIFPDDWTLLDKINFIQRKILLNSVLYYIYDTNFISDAHYDDCCKKLVKLHTAYGPDFVEDSMYGYAFYDFDGSTGYHLYNRLTLEDQAYLAILIQLKLDRKEG